jgi:short-subunit dehydrogenase
MTEHWLVVGASSAIARAFVRELARRGAAVTLAGRDLDDLQAIAADAGLRGAPSALAFRCDVADASSRDDLMAELPQDGSVLNVLLAVGNMPAQEAMDTDPALLSTMLATNYTGPVALLQALAARLEVQRAGRIVVIGSVAGDRGRRKNYLYGSAKAGLGLYADGLRARLYPAGVSVTLIKPGFVDTAMTWGLPGLFLVASPEQCARRMLDAADRGAPTAYVPFFWRYIMLVIRHIPAQVMKKLNF